jgi:glycosyltransferase involved in cell wall biosynthesis
MANASFYEGFGMTVLEAMRYGVPCAISDIAVYHEVAGDSAVYFDQTDPSDISSTIGALLQNPNELRTRSQAATARANSFNWQTVARSLYDYITRALQKIS